MVFTGRLVRFGLLTLLLAAAEPAGAQGWFGNLFGGGSPAPRRGAPAYPGYGGGYGYGGGGYRPQEDEYERPRPRHHTQRRKPPVVEDAQAEPSKAPPKNATMFVDVFGDSLGQTLANGLDDALADRADVGVVHKALGSSGLVTADFYNWPKQIDDLLAGRDEAREGGASPSKEVKGADAAKASEGRTPADKKADAGGKGDGKPTAGKAPKIDVAVMMIGSNDRQSIRENGKTLAFGTPEWTAAYGKRVTAIDEDFRAHGVPLIWVGVPITKDDRFADAMASLNDITREAAAKTGAIYVDTWEAFSDDNGDFSTFGPDVNGQTTRLRAADGINFTKAGARKLAHFVETHVRRALDGKTPAPQLPIEAPETGGKGGKPVAAKPDAGPIRSLNEIPTASNGELAGAAKDGPKPDELVTTTMVHGEAVPVPAGRADDARWSPGNGRDP